MAKWTKKQRMQYFANKSKKGAVANSGAVLSDFQRGRNLGRAEQIGQELGQHKYRCSDEQGKAEIAAQQKAFAESRQKKFEAWCRKQQKAAAKAKK